MMSLHCCLAASHAIADRGSEYQYSLHVPFRVTRERAVIQRNLDILIKSANSFEEPN